MRSFRTWRTGNLQSRIENIAGSARRQTGHYPAYCIRRAPSIRCTKCELFSQPRVTGILVETGVPGRVLMAVLASGQIPCGEWVRFVMPLIAMWFVICIGALIVGIWIDWGPS